jgi:hypothetical protein
MIKQEDEDKEALQIVTVEDTETAERITKAYLRPWPTCAALLVAEVRIAAEKALLERLVSEECVEIVAQAMSDAMGGQTLQAYEALRAVAKHLEKRDDRS